MFLYFCRGTKGSPSPVCAVLPYIYTHICLKNILSLKNPFWTELVFMEDVGEINVSQAYFVILILSESAMSVFLTQPQ